MALPVIVVGAGGRMGRLLCELVMDAPDMELCGMVERIEYQPGVVPVDCVVSDDMDSVVASCPDEAAIVDFSTPESSMHSAEVAAKRGRPLVIGTTGLDPKQLETLGQLARKTPIFWSPNMSIGGSVIQRLLPELARELGEDYDVDIMEIHHRKKVDAPSGTALRFADCVAEGKGWKGSEVRVSARDGQIGPRPKKEIGVMALRGGGVVGVHTVYYMGPGETIEITHRAESRRNFAKGALRAAQWLSKKEPGKLYGMADLF